MLYLVISIKGVTCFTLSYSK